MEQTSAPSKIPTCIGLPPDLRDRLDAAAVKADRSRSWIAATAIAEYLARQAADPTQADPA